MTDPRQDERERVARKCIRDTEEVWNRVCHIDDETHAALVRNITNLLKTTEAAVLEEAATLCDAMQLSPSHNIAVALRFIAEERRS